MANVHAERGDLVASEAYYRKTLRYDPDSLGAYGVLATHLRDKMPIEDVAAMHRFLEREHLSDWNRALLHHGLAHVYDARKEFEKAGEHANQANFHRKVTWAREGKDYNREDHSGFVTFLMK